MHKKNATIFVAFLLFGILAPNAPGALAQPQTATKLDLIVVTDTSAPLGPSVDSVCNNLGSAINDLNATGAYDIDYYLLGITERASCPGQTKYITSLFGTTLSNDREDWGPAVQDIATQYQWRSEAMRVVVAIGDECPDGGGFTCNNEDYNSVDNAHLTADIRDVTIFSITVKTPSGSPSVHDMGTRLAYGVSHGPHDSSQHFRADEPTAVSPAIESFVAKLLGATGRTNLGPGDYCKYAGPQAARDALSYIEYSKEYSDLDTQQKSDVESLMTAGFREPVGLVACGRDCDDPTTIVNEAEDCSLCSFFHLIDSIIGLIMFRIAPAVAALAIILGATLLILSRGNPSKTTNARNIILFAIGGYALMFIAWMLINSVFSGIGVKKWTGLDSEEINIQKAYGNLIWTDDTTLDSRANDLENLTFTITESDDASLIGQTRVITKIWNENDTLSGPAGQNCPDGNSADITGSPAGATTKDCIEIDLPLPNTQNINGKIQVGGWWQFSCGQ